MSNLKVDPLQNFNQMVGCNCYYLANITWYLHWLLFENKKDDMGEICKIKASDGGICKFTQYMLFADFCFFFCQFIVDSL
jgi:hypothetical protein